MELITINLDAIAMLVAAFIAAPVAVIGIKELSHASADQ